MPECKVQRGSPAALVIGVWVAGLAAPAVSVASEPQTMPSRVEEEAGGLPAPCKFWATLTEGTQSIYWGTLSLDGSMTQRKSVTVRTAACELADKPFGIRRGWYDDGRLALEEEYDRTSVRIRARQWFENGVLGQDWWRGHHLKVWYPSGALEGEVALDTEGHATGAYARYFENGQKTEEGTLRPGRSNVPARYGCIRGAACALLTGLARKWYADGVLRSEMRHDRKGLPHGLEKRWHPNAQREAEVTWSKGQVVRGRTWYGNGKLASRRSGLLEVQYAWTGERLYRTRRDRLLCPEGLFRQTKVESGPKGSPSMSSSCTPVRRRNMECSIFELGPCGGPVAHTRIFTPSGSAHVTYVERFAPGSSITRRVWQWDLLGRPSHSGAYVQFDRHGVWRGVWWTGAPRWQLRFNRDVPVGEPECWDIDGRSAECELNAAELRATLR